MKTSCFATYQGPGRICIARFAPRGTPAGFRIFRNLAPGPWFNSVTKTVYLRLFDKEVLGPLDPQDTWDKLHELAAGAEPVLLCWEKPPLTAKNWCHRRIVAEWFEEHLGVEVPELGQGQIAIPTKKLERARESNPVRRLETDGAPPRAANPSTFSRGGY